MAEYGMIYDANNIKRQLYESNRGYNQRQTFKQLYTNNSLAGQQAASSVLYDYSKLVNDAYAAASENKSNIVNSSLGDGYKSKLMQENDAALQEAFNTYSNNLAMQRSEIGQQVMDNAEAIDAAALQQATNIKDYANSHFDYLDTLYNGYIEGENQLFDNPQWAKYLHTDDETGETRLLTKQELLTPTWEEYEDENGNKQKQYTSLYDEQGNLTMRGVDFFDQLENQNINGYSFGNYLAENNEELYNWSKSYNPYNYTFDGTNKGSFRTMVGMASTDNVYSFAERFGGLTKGEIDEMYGGFNKALDELNNEIGKVSVKDPKSIDKSVQGKVRNLTSELKKLAEDLGIDQELNDAFGGKNWDSIDAAIEKYISGTRTQGQMAGDWFGEFFTYTGTAAAAGAGIGSAIGSIVPAPLMGTGIGAGAGAAVGAIVGAIGGLIMGSVSVNNSRKQNKEMAVKSKELYADVLNSMVNYSLQKRKQAEIDFNSNTNRF